MLSSRKELSSLYYIISVVTNYTKMILYGSNLDCLIQSIYSKYSTGHVCAIISPFCCIIRKYWNFTWLLWIRFIVYTLFFTRLNQTERVEHSFTLYKFHFFGGVNLLYFHARLNSLLDIIKEHSCAFINETAMLGLHWDENVHLQVPDWTHYIRKIVFVSLEYVLVRKQYLAVHLLNITVQYESYYYVYFLFLNWTKFQTFICPINKFTYSNNIYDFAHLFYL